MSEITIVDIIVLACGAMILVVWFALYFKGKGNAALFEGLSDEDYPMHEMYFVGYEVTKILGLNYKNKRDRQLRKELCSLYEPKYADYYIRVVYSQRITMALILSAFAAPMYCLTQNLLMFVLMIAGSVGAYIYYGMATRELIKKKKDEFIKMNADLSKDYLDKLYDELKKNPISVTLDDTIELNTHKKLVNKAY